MAGKYQTGNRLTFSVIGLLAGLGSSAYAQDSADDPWLDLGQITLYGSGLETSVMESPASVTVIDEGVIRRMPPQSTAALLRTVPGVIVSDNGIERISIRGEAAGRILIKIDGQALTDHTGYGQPVLVDPTTIERIEIVRGSSSVVSGSRAIGGVINITTKRGGDKPLEGSFSAGYFSANGGYRTSASIGGTTGAFDYRLSFGKSDQGNRRTPDGILAPTDLQDQSLTAHLGYTNGDHYWSFKAQSYDLAANVYTGGDPDFSVALPKRDLLKFGAFYEGTNLTPWITKLNANIYHQTIDREFVNNVNIPMPTPPFPPGTIRTVHSVSEDAQATYGLNIDAVLEFSPGHRTLVGLEYENDFIDSDKTTTTTFMGPPTVALRNNDARIKTFSIYAQHEADLSNTLTGFIGARFYKVDAALEASNISVLNSNSDSRLLGSASLVWTPKEELALRLNINQGYRYPTLQQMFMETTARGVVTTGNPNLKPEDSTTFEIGARFDNGTSVIDAAAFYTEATDYIATVSTGAMTATYENVNAATTFGLELHAETAIQNSRFTPYISATWLRRKFEYGSGFSTYDSGTPALIGKLGVRYDWELGNVVGSLDAYVQGESATTQYVAGPRPDIHAAGYGTFNISAEADISERVHLSASFNNIFNNSYEPISGLPGAERNVSVFLTAKF